MMNKVYALVFLVFGAAFFATSETESSKAKNVLVLNSYHSEYWWTEAVVEGIKDAINEEELNLNLLIEYMDTKQHDPSYLTTELIALFERKYADDKIDALLLCDNNALNFYQSEGRNIFGDIPIVFCGINNFQDSMIAELPLVTGVAEELYFEETIELAKQIHPQTQNIAIVSDMTHTDSVLRDYIQPIVKKLSYQFNFIHLRGLASSELEGRLAELPEHTIIVLLNYHLDRSGKYYTLAEGIDLLLSASDLPVYSFWESKIRAGLLGGHVESGRIQGARAMGLVIQRLKNPNLEIDVITEGPQLNAFNYQQLERFDITKADLPPNTLIFDAPNPILARYRHYIFTLLAFLVLQGILITVLIVNVRRRQQAEQAALRSKQLYQTLVDNIDFSITLRDPNYRIVLSNEKAQHILGRQICNKSGKLCHDAHSDGEGFCEECPLRLAIAENKSAVAETKALSKTGATIPVHVKTFPLTSPDGTSLGFIEVLEDITERKEAEQKILHAMKKAEVASQGKDEFLAVMSHELRTPLNPIIGYVSLMLEDDQAKPFENYLQQIANSSKQLVNLIDGILSFAHIEQEVFDTNPHSVSPIELIQGMVLQYNQNDPNRFVFENGIPEVQGDEISEELRMDHDGECIRRMIACLLDNAAKFSGENKVTIRAGKIASDRIRIEVVDQGIGIKEQDLERIFQPFTQVDSTYERHFEGIGIGLPLFVKLVHLLDGEYGVESVLGKGSTFWFELPIEVKHS